MKVTLTMDTTTTPAALDDTQPPPLAEAFLAAAAQAPARADLPEGMTWLRDA